VPVELLTFTRLVVDAEVDGVPARRLEARVLGGDVSDASAILPILGRLLAASKKPKPKKRGRPKKRPRTEGGDDDEQSDADEDAVVDESTFLVETHARQRQIRAAPPRARRLLGAPRNAPSSSSGNTKSSRLSTSSSTSNERTSRSIRLSSPRSGADRADATRASGAATRRLGAHRCVLVKLRSAFSI